MAKANDRWTVLPHKPIEKLSDHVWRVQGSLPNMALKRVMTIAKRGDGGLVIHNGICLDDASMAEIDAWGPVACILVPNAYHRLDAPVFKQRYPNAKVLCPRGGRSKVEEVVAVDGVYEDFAADDVVSLETLEGVGEQEGVMIVREPAGATVVVNDAIFNMPHVGGFSGLIFRYITASTGGPRISRLFRLFVLKDKAAFRAHLHRLADIPGLTRLIVSHHRMVQDDAAGAIRSAAADV
ncbi:MAG: hypothetical protein KC420_00840 [Myxococcales bacterium]|nr:hypothetical protein [Myxococcales bacterium]MCB9567005.1 hypothetical protein [Myxococcales bacterium]MCB9704739.1 hypothetical protein [Myxococcales bacterium]